MGLIPAIVKVPSWFRAYGTLFLSSPQHVGCTQYMATKTTVFGVEIVLNQLFEEIGKREAPPSPKVVALPRRMNLVDIGERDRRDHRAKDFLPGDPHVVAHIGVDCRRDKVSLGERAFGQLLAANNRSRPLLAGNVEVAGDAFERVMGKPQVTRLPLIPGSTRSRSPARI